MSNIKWIKLSVNMFEDEKIRLIEQMPEADTILVIWVKLLSQAGKTNSSGYIFLAENIPYTDEMLATIFNRPLGTIRLALETFKAFGMIEIDDQSFISISNWEKHQNVDALEKIREDTRKRVAKHRERQKSKKVTKKLHVTKKTEAKPLNDKVNEPCNVTVTKSNATEEELEEELEEERDIKKDRVEQKKPKDFTAKIKALLPVFSSIPNFNQLSKKYWNAIRETRKTKTVAESVIYRNMSLWTSYDPVVIEYALKEHIDNHSGKKEDYTIGIMRNTTVEEVKQARTKKKRRPFGKQTREENLPEWYEEHRKQVAETEKKKELERKKNENLNEEEVMKELDDLINSVK